MPPKVNKLEEEYALMSGGGGALSSQKHKGGRYLGNRNRKKRSPKAADDHGGDVQLHLLQQHMAQKDWKHQQPGKYSSTEQRDVLNAKTPSSRGSRKNDASASDSHQGSRTTTDTLNAGDYGDTFDAVNRSKPSNRHLQGPRSKPERNVSVSNGKGRKQSKTTLASPSPLSSNSGFASSTGKGVVQRNTARGKPYRK